MAYMDPMGSRMDDDQGYPPISGNLHLPHLAHLALESQGSSLRLDSQWTPLLSPGVILGEWHRTILYTDETSRFVMVVPNTSLICERNKMNKEYKDMLVQGPSRGIICPHSCWIYP